ncbi:plastocyanin/azurin family copper-binding protein [Altericista sp. CCNU0014]|uniref:plastocyanin/azurin family copper-binding protein n=1 Tax=Altericista sp. CCNU0014 TaxID=3082949 RepID=UPI00384EA4B9
MVSRFGLSPRWQRVFIVGICAIAILFCPLGFMADPAFAAAVTLAKQPPITKTIALGSAAGDLKFMPDRLAFKAGTRYRLMLENPSSLKHYFTAKDFADAIWSQKVDAGNVEIKGAIHELELRPGSHAEWVFIPLRAGIYPLRCTVPGHTEAGMVGSLEITG